MTDLKIIKIPKVPESLFKLAEVAGKVAQSHDFIGLAEIMLPYLAAETRANEIEAFMKKATISEIRNMSPIDGLTALSLLIRANKNFKQKSREQIRELVRRRRKRDSIRRRKLATNAADTRHSMPGGSRDKQREIRDIWATGKYSSRDICAEQEFAALDWNYSSARKALRNTPDPF